MRGHGRLCSLRKSSSSATRKLARRASECVMFELLTRLRFVLVFRIFSAALCVSVNSAFPETTLAADTDFAQLVQPFLEQNCQRCHSGADAKADLQFESLASEVRTGEVEIWARIGDPEHRPVASIEHPVSRTRPSLRPVSLVRSGQARGEPDVLLCVVE